MSAPVLGRAGAWLAAVPVPPGAPGAPGAERGEEFGKTSPIALVVILLLGVATALLIRSMSKRLKNIPESFDDPPPAGVRPDADDGPDGLDGSPTPVDRTEGPPRTGSP